MHNIDITIVTRSKIKYIIYLFIACVFMAAGIWILSLSLNESPFPAHRDLLFLRSLGIMSIVFGGIGLFILSKQFFDRKPALLFDENGFVDHTNGASIGQQIPWSEIVSAKTVQFQDDTYLVIEVKDPQKYLYRKNRAKQMLVSVNYKIFGSPIIIAGIGLTASTPELLSIFNQYQQKYGVPRPNA